MSLSHWIKPTPAKRVHLEDSSKSEDDEYEEADLGLDNETTTTEDLRSNESNGGDASQSSVSGSSRSGSSKQSKYFNGLWLTGRRHWLKHEKATGMFCLLCQKYDKRPYDRDIWNKTGCTRIRLQSIIRHEKSAAHQDCLKRESESASAVNIASAISPSVPLNTIQQTFGCLYFLVKQKIAHTTNFEPLLDFLEYLGVHIKSNIRVAKNATYTSRKSIQEMVSILSEVMENTILSFINNSEHIAIMFDESTDCTVTEQLVLHCRYIEKDTGELKSNFLKVIDALGLCESVEGESDRSSRTVSLNADTITAHILKYLDDIKLDMNKIRGIGTDGASTILGCRNGVVAQLKRIRPSAIGVHCAAHRLNLASSQAGDTVPYVKKFNTIIRQLFDFYANSAVRHSWVGRGTKPSSRKTYQNLRTLCHKMA